MKFVATEIEEFEILYRALYEYALNHKRDLSCEDAAFLYNLRFRLDECFSELK